MCIYCGSILHYDEYAQVLGDWSQPVKRTKLFRLLQYRWPKSPQLPFYIFLYLDNKLRILADLDSLKDLSICPGYKEYKTTWHCAKNAWKYPRGGGHSPRKRAGMLGWRRESFDLRYSTNSQKLRTFKQKNSEFCGPLEPKQWKSWTFRSKTVKIEDL